MLPPLVTTPPLPVAPPVLELPPVPWAPPVPGAAELLPPDPPLPWVAAPLSAQAPPKAVPRITIPSKTLLFLMVQPFSLPTKRKGAKSLKPSWIRDVHRRYIAELQPCHDSYRWSPGTGGTSKNSASLQGHRFVF
jgi:hypothetical protein